MTVYRKQRALDVELHRNVGELSTPGWGLMIMDMRRPAAVSLRVLNGNPKYHCLLEDDQFCGKEEDSSTCLRYEIK